jgi:FkbM family methyltransferase
MYDRFLWSGPSARRNLAMAEYEPFQPYYLMALADQAACVTFLDVGANVGAYSVFASRIPSIRRIVAFEANPKAAREVTANALLNGLDIEVRQQAVSASAGETIFGVVSDLAGNNGVVSTALHNGFHRSISVETIALDSMAFVGPVCLKIDVEGHEAAVIEGARNLLTSLKCVVQMEGYKDEAGGSLEAMGYSRLTRIGPDDYFTNIAGLSALETYEAAMVAFIESQHRAKATTMKFGDISLTLTGQTADRARRVARSLMGSRL